MHQAVTYVSGYFSENHGERASLSEVRRIRPAGRGSIQSRGVNSLFSTSSDSNASANFRDITSSSVSYRAVYRSRCWRRSRSLSFSTRGAGTLIPCGFCEKRRVEYASFPWEYSAPHPTGCGAEMVEFRCRSQHENGRWTIDIISVNYLIIPK